MKIAVIGYSGSGKSTLAKRISEEYSLPLLYLDTVHWLPDWCERDTEEAQKIVSDWMDTHDSWVIDGNYRKYYRERKFEEADYIVFLAFPRLRCLYRAWKRSRTFRGKSRDSMTMGCDEKFDREFVLWILKNGRSREIVKAYRDTGKRYPDKFYRCTCDRQVNSFLEMLRKAEAAK